MTYYQIQGNVSLKYEKDLKILLTPATGYVSPDKKNAVFYPKDNLTKALMKLIENNVIELSFDAVADADIKSVLIAVANSQKVILLEVDDKLKIVGFTFPAK